MAEPETHEEQQPLTWLRQALEEHQRRRDGLAFRLFGPPEPDAEHGHDGPSAS